MFHKEKHFIYCCEVVTKQETRWLINHFEISPRIICHCNRPIFKTTCIIRALWSGRMGSLYRKCPHTKCSVKKWPEIIFKNSYKIVKRAVDLLLEHLKVNTIFQGEGPPDPPPPPLPCSGRTLCHQTNIQLVISNLNFIPAHDKLMKSEL